MWWWWRKPAGNSSFVEPNIWKICKESVRTIEDIVSGGDLLNRRQCLDFSIKLAKTAQNIEELMFHCGAEAVTFRLVLENLYVHLEKARVLVRKCGEEDWCRAAVFQIRNENSFREILLDVGLCYNTIYELAKSSSREWTVQTEDLRQSPTFQSATDNDIHLDQESLWKRLEGLTNKPSGAFNLLDTGFNLRTDTGAHLQFLARYLQAMLDYCTSDQSSANSLYRESRILWRGASEPSKTWGNSRFIGAGSGASGVCSTTWLGIPCAKKEFHEQEFEGLFLKEAIIQADLNHPRVVKFFCYGNDQKTEHNHFIATELMEKNLLRLIEDQGSVPFALPVAVNIMAQLARGMSYLHDQGIAHRDLKPQHVVVTKFTSPHLVSYFDVKLIDFGMSKENVEEFKSITMTCRGIGTTRYRAPEIFPQAHTEQRGIGKAIWFKADVFSFANTCAHVLSLRRPYGDEIIPSELYSLLASGSLRPELPTDCPEELAALLRDCWDLQPCLRPSFVEISTRLEVFYHKLLRGLPADQDLQDGTTEFTRSKLKEQSCTQRQRQCVAISNDEDEDLLDEREGLPDKMVQITRGLLDKMVQITRGLLDKMVQITRGLLDKMVQITRGTLDEREGLLDKMVQITRGTLDEREGLLDKMVQITRDLANGKILLNKRQCHHLSLKLSEIIRNVQELVLHCGAPADLFGLSLENLYRFFEKARLLVNTCRNDDWCAESVYQIQNENSFREILLEVSLCYKAVYELAKNRCNSLNFDLQDPSRKSDMFSPASIRCVREDQQEIKKKLENLVNHYGSRMSESLYLQQCLAKYLLLRLNFISQESQIKNLDERSAIFWTKKKEPPTIWGSDHFIRNGAGASGTVVITKWLGISCAKKIFDGKDFEYCFFKEAGILVHLNHPRIVNFICCGNGQETGDRFIAMELMDKSLRAVIEAQGVIPFPLPVAVDVIVQIARGMCYLHEVGVAHRDVKPDNVVVKLTHMNYFSVKLVDFDISKAEIEVTNTMTMSGVGIGTTRYRAPELHPKGPVEGLPKEEQRAIWFKADVYSFAMTCAHILSLKSPFHEKGNNVLAKKPMYNALIEGARPELSNCPEELAALIRDCWLTNPRSRPSFKEICTRLEAFYLKLLSGLYTPDHKLQDGKLELMHHNSPLAAMNCDIPVYVCASGHSLQLMPRSVCDSATQFICSICQNQGDGELYCCQICGYDIHPACVVNEDRVEVFFHPDPLHLLIQDYYVGDPDTICSFCEESVQDNEWVYKCEPCEYNAHALCTKYNRKIMHTSHPHPLTLVPRRLSKNLSCMNLFCSGCKGVLKGYRYTCTQKSCTFELHPFCAILPGQPHCLFDNSHLLSLDTQQRAFQCGKCATMGDSWLYHCDQCNMDLHVECIDGMEEVENDDWKKVYDDCMAEYCNKDDEAKAIMLQRLLDRLLENQAKIQVSEVRTQASSSSSLRPQPVTRKGKAKAKMPTLSETYTLGPVDIFDNHGKNATDLTTERKAKKKLAKEARQKALAHLKEEQDARLDNVGKLQQDLQSSKSVSQTDAFALAAKYQKLRTVHDTSHAFRTTQAYMRTRRVPRVILFSEQQANMTQKLLTSFQLSIREVQLQLLCEEPDHEHIVSSPLTCEINQGTEELWQRFLPLLASTGLQTVAKTINALDLSTEVESILPNMGEHRWDIQAMDLGEYGAQCRHVLEDGEIVEALERAKAEETAAVQWLANYLEQKEISIFKVFGLLRIRYKESERRLFPRYRQGSLAWLCSNHQKHGLEAGILEPYPVRVYYNIEYDKQHLVLN